MKKKTTILILLVIAALFLATSVAYAQVAGFDLSWWTVDGGGGNSSGSGYALSGTIGQPDAGAMSGGDYQLAGGFWGASTSSTGDSIPVYLPLVVR